IGRRVGRRVSRCSGWSGCLRQTQDRIALRGAVAGLGALRAHARCRLADAVVLSLTHARAGTVAGSDRRIAIRVRGARGADGTGGAEATIGVAVAQVAQLAIEQSAGAEAGVAITIHRALCTEQ